jgi:tyrosyl-tRNA synthetase
MPEKLPYKKPIANKIKRLIKAGVSMRDIFADVQGMKGAPSSPTSIYKIYGEDIAEARAKIYEAVGSRVVEQALHGDPKEAATFKSQELFLRSKAGWSPTSTVQEQELEKDPDTDVSAIDELMTLLGKSSKSDE